MWIRAELKDRAKSNLRRYYWTAFAVSLIYMIVNTVVGRGESGGPGIHFTLIDKQPVASTGAVGRMIFSAAEAIDAHVLGGMGFVKSGMNIYESIATGVAAGIFTSFIALLILVSALASLLILPALEVGSNRFYMESRMWGQSAGVERLFWGFSHHYWNIVWTMFLRGLIIALGFICCFLPGIYFTYCYFMVPYILSENPEMKPMEALRLSKDMMNGNKVETWILGLSFIGWFLLGILACGVGTYFVIPYMEATYAELYGELRKEYSAVLSGYDQ